MAPRTWTLALAVAFAFAACAPGRHAAAGATSASGRTPGAWYRSLSRSGAPVMVGEVPPADGHWMSAPDEVEPTGEEHRAFSEGLAARVEGLLEESGLEATGRPGAAYVRGDFFGAREEELYAYGERFAGRPGVLVEVVRAAQAYLREHPRWRVILPLGEGTAAAMVVYPARIFHGPRQLDDEALAEVVARYVEEEGRQDEEERAARRSLFDAVAPSLRDAVRRALADGAPRLVSRERRHDAVLVWAVVPRVADATGAYADDVRVEPSPIDALDFMLDAGGAELPDPATWGDAVAVLRVWAFDDVALRGVRVAKGTWSATWSVGE